MRLGARTARPTIMLAISGWPMARLLLKVVTLDRQLVILGALGFV